MAARRSFLLRLSPELWEDINLWAKDELRSVNAQMEYILREAVRRRKRQTDGAEDDSKSDAQDDA